MLTCCRGVLCPAVIQKLIPREGKLHGKQPGYRGVGHLSGRAHCWWRAGGACLWPSPAMARHLSPTSSDSAPVCRGGHRRDQIRGGDPPYPSHLMLAASQGIEPHSTGIWNPVASQRTGHPSLSRCHLLRTFPGSAGYTPQGEEEEFHGARAPPHVLYGAQSPVDFADRYSPKLV